MDDHISHADLQGPGAGAGLSGLLWRRGQKRREKQEFLMGFAGGLLGF